MRKDSAKEEEFTELIGQHKGLLFKVARIYCRNEDDRQDLIQEILIHIWKALPGYNPQFAITTWLYRIALNVAISFYRKDAKRLSNSIPLFDEHLSIHDDSGDERKEKLQLLEQFISGLNSLDKAMIMLYLEDKSHAEMSEIMGLSVSNVGTRLSRIKEKLRKKYNQLNAG